jgi:hypothetical protein
MNRSPRTPNPPTESRNVIHCPALPGFTFADVLRSSSPWRVYNYQYALCFPSTWAASVIVDGRQADFGPGDGLFTMPGEVHWTPKIRQQGDLRVLIIDEGVFRQLAEEGGVRAKQVSWTHAFTRPSPALVRAFNEVFRTLYDQPGALQLQTELVDFFGLLARERLLGSQTDPKVGPRSLAKRMRELIHHSADGLRLNLSELANVSSIKAT